MSKSWTEIRPSRLPLDAELTVHFLTVGSSACTLIECPNGPPIFVECGSDAGTGGDHAMTFAEASTYNAPILEANPQPPNVVVAHGHTDHFNWIDGLLEDRQPGGVWLGGFVEDYAAISETGWTVCPHLSRSTRTSPGTGTTTPNRSELI